MPEYLAPGVYVEEVPSGSKPIEGVSTSTTGMVGVTQRGPVNEPTLVTSFADFTRRFGGYLDHRIYTNDRDALPYAAEGYFANGGQRLYITRIVGENATFSSVDLYGIPTGAADTTLVRRVAEGGDTLTLDSGANIASGDMLLIVDGPRSEYVTVEADPFPVGARLAGRLHFAHAAGAAVAVQTVTVGDNLTNLVAADMTAGGGLLLTDASGLNAGDILRIRDTANPAITEFVTITNDGQADIDEPGLLFAHPLATTELHRVTMANAGGEPGGRALTADANPGDPFLLLTDTGGLDNAVVRVGDEFHAVRNVISSVFIATTPVGMRLQGSLHFDHDEGDAVARQNVTDGDDLTALVDGNMTAGGGLVLSNAAGLNAGDILRIRDTANPAITEFVTVTNDAAADIDEPGLLFDHPQATTQLHRVTLADAAGEPGGRSVQADAAAGDSVIPLNTTANLAAGNVVRIGVGATREFQVIRNVIEVPAGTTASAFRAIHAAGVRVVSQVPLIRVHARHQGQWGNDLRVRIRRSSLLETEVAGNFGVGDSPVLLGATFGLTTGSVLELTSGNTVIRQRIAGVNHETGEVELEGGAGIALQEGDAARSVEFDVVVERLEKGKVAETESFPSLGMVADHFRNATQIVGGFDVGAGRPELAGESELIRLSDLTAGNPDRLLSLPFANGTTTADLADLYRMSGGSDDLATINANAYIGQPSVDPDDRTGIFSLENVDSISIVAVPGQTSQDVQNALLNHCALMRYRFAVLDSQRNARMRDVQTQRQQYDTTYGAIYYPWLVITDAFGRNGDVRNIPSSGHVAGIYARADIERGVHKAPANEVVRGIRDLQVRLTKGEQDILNPIHVNVIRDFRDLNRGLRVWGARTLSSDPEWRYINVRRLFLFVEKSIERGTQFAVFEPNAEPLWGTIHRSVTNFLTAVWRDGALEGTTPEEAFFVKVDRTTMTQQDIDTGRLIILVGIAPVKPAEFVIFRISQKTREATA